jgi:Adenylate and Guanylate cyclase catalytic domain
LIDFNTIFGQKISSAVLSFRVQMNTASRIESTGVSDRIHISQATASLLIAAGKEKWVVPREQKITAKGKGELTTYFLNIPNRHGDAKYFGPLSQNEGNLLDLGIVDLVAVEEKKNRIAEWTVEVLASALKTIVASRKSKKSKPDPAEKIEVLESMSLLHSGDNKSVIDEVVTCISLPDHSVDHNVSEGDTTLSDNIMEELRDYVQKIASLYKNNPFHNFDHANHVVMSVNKLFSRINAPDIEVDATGKKLHDHTYGITSDPLIRYVTLHIDTVNL